MMPWGLGMDQCLVGPLRNNNKDETKIFLPLGMYNLGTDNPRKDETHMFLEMEK